MKLHNTLTGSVDTLTPLNPGRVSLYTCGLTVYSQPHIGNWLGYIYWDILVRTLKAEGLNVERTQNITDVGHLTSDDDNGEDKMEKGAKVEGSTAWNVAKKYSEIAEHEAYDLLGLIRPDHLVAATSLIDQQIEFAQKLDEKGYLYEISGDGMYFDTSKLDDYGKLARLDVGGLEGGIRVAVDGKKHITDFAVWKFSPEDVKRDMEWDSPWGVGFPGWHLECSVIARETLGDQIDIHTGGIDHIPVHHTNEIAQTESLTGTKFAQIWLHNNHIKIDGKKISKSLGNTYTLQDIIDKGFSMDAFKLMALSKHYRTEGNFSWEILEAANNRLQRWRNMAALRWQTHDTLTDDDEKDSSFNVNGVVLAAPHAGFERLSNDLDTPGALTAIEQAFDAIEQAPLHTIQRSALVALIEWIDETLGLRLLETTPDIPNEAKQLILERQRARENKDWTSSDELRDELELTYQVALLDTPSGVMWHYV
jgi:cysteinyl-tRNA synthetase